MSRRARRRLVAGVLVALVGAACGKRGNPLPPLRLMPAQIADFAAHRVDDRVELSWTVPAANTDGTTPAAVERIEIFAVSTAAGATAPTAAALAADAPHLLTRVLVRRETAAPTPAGATPLPAPGERVVFVERVAEPIDASAATRHYVAVGVAGPGRGRPGPPSEVITVPIPAARLPAPPGGVAATHTEATLTLAWQPGAPSQTFRVLASGAVFDPDQAKAVTPVPVTASTFTTPVEFGRERCFVVRAISVTGKATVEGAPTAPVCITPIDRFPPPAPTGLQAIQEAAAVTLTWTGVDAADLAGYIVLRGEGGGENMQPLVREPIHSPTYTDAAVLAGVTYVYAVYAQDNAPTPNVSQLSDRQTVTVR